jgi:peptidoglycan-N-acetylglucosamine deacetylase
MQFRLLYPNFKKRAIVFSYDDGVLQDKRLLEILNSHHLVGTFNLNYGKSGEERIRSGIDCSRLVLKDNVSLFNGHEVADHTFSHPHLEGLGLEAQFAEYIDNVQNLGALFGRSIVGSAYPYGTYDENTKRALRSVGLLYSRTTKSTYSFALPTDWYLWNPTIHHRDPLLKATLDRFASAEDELALFMLWGHSYEFALDDNFSLMEELSSKVEAMEDVYNASCAEVNQYCLASQMVYFREGYFVNPSAKDIYLSCEGKNYLVKSHGRQAGPTVKGGVR